MNFTDEARELWNKLSNDDKEAWTSNVTCQKCSAGIDKNNFNASVYEGNLALFHECRCGNKEIRLIDVTMQNQQAIDDDFEQWKKAKTKARSRQSEGQK